MKTNTLKSFLTITLAMFIISVAIYFFLIPSEVITGSVTGLAIYFYTYLCDQRLIVDSRYRSNW